MLKYKQLYVSTIIFVTWLFVASSLSSDLFLKIRNNQNEKVQSEENDELGGSLLDILAENPEQNNDLFAKPDEPESTLEEPKDLEQVVDQVNNEPAPVPIKLEPTQKNQTVIKPQQNDSNKTEINKLEKEIGIVKQERINNDLLDNPQVIIVYKNQTCNVTIPKNVHSIFPTPETSNMKYYSLITIIFFGFTYLIFRGIFALLKHNNSFFSKAIKMLAHQTLLYFICIVVLFSLYVLGALDSIPVNFEYLIDGLAIFGLSWIIFCIIIIVFCIFVIRKWNELETNAKDFKSIKSKYEKAIYKSYPVTEQNKKVDTSYFFELYEYLVLKIYFCVPFFPIFKASTLRKDFNFSVYLKYCLLEKLRYFFKLSWTCWVLTIFSIIIWSVFIATSEIETITIIMLCFPLVGIIVGVAIYLYLRSLYRKVIMEVTENNYMEFTDLEQFSQQHATGRFLNYPLYIDNIMKKPKLAQISKFNLHEHFHHRSPSLYEDIIFFGASGFYILSNFLQSVSFIFVVWNVIICTKHLSSILNNYGNDFLFLIIPLMILYLIGYSFIITITLRWYTVISSVNNIFNSLD